MRRPKLNRVPPVPRCDAGQCIVTMSVGHWDEILQQAYRQGWPLLELDGNEMPIAAHRRQVGMDGHGVVPLS